MLIKGLDSDENVLIALQRIRDMHNPAVIAETENRVKAEGAFNQFALSLLLAYIEMTEPVWMHAQKQTNTKVDSVKRHLQDMIVQGTNQHSNAILVYIKRQMASAAELLKSARDLAET